MYCFSTQADKAYCAPRNPSGAIQFSTEEAAAAGTTIHLNDGWIFLFFNQQICAANRKPRSASHKNKAHSVDWPICPPKSPCRLTLRLVGYNTFTCGPFACRSGLASSAQPAGIRHLILREPRKRTANPHQCKKFLGRMT